MTFNDNRPDLKRRTAYGSIGEKSFERFCLRNEIVFKPFGISREESMAMGKDNYFKIPKLIQSSPDYFMIRKKFNFVECKVADKETASHVKIKETDLKYYKQWSSVESLLFYIHNPKYSESYLVEMCYIEQLFESGELDVGYYPDNNKTFYKIPMEDISRFGKQV